MPFARIKALADRYATIVAGSSETDLPNEGGTDGIASTGSQSVAPPLAAIPPTTQ